MSSLRSSICASMFALATFTTSCSARALWIPEHFDPRAGDVLQPRGAPTACGGHASLTQCSSSFPPSFCCSPGTACMAIFTGNTSITSAICCPIGQNCNRIGPISCQQTLQDATQFPASQLHSQPPQQLAPCGSGCCPLGFACNNGQCIASSPLSTGTLSAASTRTTSISRATATKSNTQSSAAADSDQSNGIAKTSSDVGFNSKSFAAGFVPGIALGIIVAVLVFFSLCFRHRNRQPKTYNDKTRDTLTDLGTLRPAMHGRSISEPTVDPSLGTRTDFLRSSPPRTAESDAGIEKTHMVTVSHPETPIIHDSKVKALFSHSPFMNHTPSTPPMTQPPIPAHLKRGTLSFHISPIRALKKQKSMHSLRRQMTNASHRGSAINRTASTETIQVLMPSNGPYTPDQRITKEQSNMQSSARYQSPRSAVTWGSLSSPEVQRTEQRAPYASSSRYPSTQPAFKMASPPPPLPGHTNGGMAFLDSPYTPTRRPGAGAGLTVPGGPAEAKRDTTFSALMEKAGLRKSDLVMGTRKKIDAKYGL